MKNFYALLFVCMAAFYADLLPAQDLDNPYTYAGATPGLVEGIVAELVATHTTGMTDASGSVIPAGSKTYRLYVDMLEGNDFLTAVGATIGCSLPLQFTTTTSFYNNAAFGSEIAQGINPGLFGFFGTIVFDTWFTIGAENNLNNCNGNGNVTMAPSASMPCHNPTAQTFSQAAGISFCRQDGGYFILNNNNPCGFGVGPNNRVLIGQFTTNGDFDWQIGTLTVIENATPGQAQSYFYGFSEVNGFDNCTSFNNSSVNGYFEESTCLPGFSGVMPNQACLTGEGCTDSAACNFNPFAAEDDGSCEYASCLGCTDPQACNFNPTATVNNGPCDYTTCTGCTNPLACNFDSSAIINDGTCLFPGCTDPIATNYNPAAGCSNGSCTYPVPGCTISSACNYNPAATVNDGSCTMPGCTDPDANNYNPAAGCDNGSCTYQNCSAVPPACVDGSSWAYQQTVADDPFCCTNTWDSLCQSAYDSYSSSCGGQGGGGGSGGNGTGQGQNCADAIPISCASSSVYNSTIGVPNDNLSSGANTCSGVGTAGQIWYSFVTSTNTNVALSTCGANWDTKISVYTGSCGALTCEAQNDDYCGLQSQVTFTALAGQTYLVRVGGFNNATGNFTMNIFCDNPCISPPACVNVLSAAYQAVITSDPFCCSTLWDADCQSAYNTLSSTCASPCVPVTVQMFDSFGDGWNGAEYHIYELIVFYSGTLPADTVFVNAGSGTLSSGAAGLETYCLSSGCYVINVSGGTFPGEVSWALLGADGGTISGVAPANVTFSINSDCSGGPIAGCTDPAACNYQSNASEDNGSCSYACYGCNVGYACNYNPLATINDDSCEYESCAGCTDPGACNYNPGATLDDGLCDYACIGCTDPLACNFDPETSIDDSTCDFSCYGCLNPDALNYDALATLDDNSCVFPPCYPTAPQVVDYCSENNENVIYQFQALPGEQVSVHFTAGFLETCCDHLKVFDSDNTELGYFGAFNGEMAGLWFTSTGGILTLQLLTDVSVSCVTSGYEALSFEVYCAAPIEYPIPGCTNPIALNYNPNATVDDGSCQIPGGFAYNPPVESSPWGGFDGEGFTFGMAPNPGTGPVLLSLFNVKTKQPVVIRLFNLLGQKVVEHIHNDVVDAPHVQLDLSLLMSGVYLVTVEVDGVHQTQRWVKQ